MPYNISVVMLDDTDDIRIISNVIDVAPADMKIGMPVKLVWEPFAGGGYAPRFRANALS